MPINNWAAWQCSVTPQWRAWDRDNFSCASCALPEVRILEKDGAFKRHGDCTPCLWDSSDHCITGVTSTHLGSSVLMTC